MTLTLPNVTGEPCFTVRNQNHPLTFSGASRVWDSSLESEAELPPAVTRERRLTPPCQPDRWRGPIWGALPSKFHTAQPRMVRAEKGLERCVMAGPGAEGSREDRAADPGLSCETNRPVDATLSLPALAHTPPVLASLRTARWLRENTLVLGGDLQAQARGYMALLPA